MSQRIKRPFAFYYYPMSFRHTAALTTNNEVWAFKVPAAATLRVRLLGLRGSLNFDGTAVAASQAQYELLRFSGGDAPTDGNAVTVVKADTSSGTSVLTTSDIRISTGGAALTHGGSPTYEGGPIQRLGIPLSATGVFLPVNYRFAEGKGLVFLPGEGAAVRLVAASAIGVAFHMAFEALEERHP